ncbi:MAG: GIY-YIG nuclease family protein [Chthoniobacterales bacterium]
MKRFFVYIMSNKSRVVLSIGGRNSLERRVWQHRSGDVEGFTSRYNLDRLVYYEEYPDALSAIGREKQLKRWSRAKKNALLETLNPLWRDLGPELCGDQM